MNKTLSRYALFFILLAEGWASLGTEILALRRAATWVGSTVDVTTVLLAVYLAALAGGYRRGGRLAELDNPRSRLALRLSSAALWSAFWLSDIGLTLVFSLPATPLLQTLAYSLFGIAPVGWLLAETVLLAHACSPLKAASERAGTVFSLSTVGNVAGALSATFLLMPTLGVASAVLSIVIAAAAAAIVAQPRAFAVHTLLFALCWPLLDLWNEATLYVSRNAYADYRILDLSADTRILSVNNQAASRHDSQGKGWEYAELLEHTLCDAKEHRVLVLGAAGMTIGQNAPCQLQITFVDIDPEQASIAAQFLQSPIEDSIRFVVSDGRAFLRNNTTSWQAIVVDAFTNPRSIPHHLLTIEFYRLARSQLASNGSLYVNHTTYPGEELFISRIDRTLRSVFASCVVRATQLPPDTSWHEESGIDRNLLYRCRKSSHDDDRIVYSDSVSRAELDRSLHLHDPRKRRTISMKGDLTYE